MKDQWIVIVNVYATSRKAGSLWREAEAMLKARGIDYHCRLTGVDGNASDLAHAAAAEGYRRLVAVGGDGTVHDVLNGIAAYLDWAVEAGKSLNFSDFTLGVIPVGSGNDWII